MAVAADKDVPRLSLSLDYPQGTSPFPSPSSAFLPPPVHSVHEAWTLPAGRFAKERQQLRRDSESSHTSSTNSDLPSTTETASATAIMNGSTSMTSTATTNGKDTSKMNGDVPSTPSTPHPPPSLSATPTKATSPNPISNPTNITNRTSLTPNIPPNISTSKPISIPFRTPTSSSTTTPTTIAFSTSGTGSSPGLNSSLLSTRPAPPSPAPSRRTSTVINGIGATSLSRTPSSRRTSALSPSINGGFSPAPPIGISTSLSQSLSYLEPAKPPARRRLPIVKVIDFGFTDPEDERRNGLGPDTPRANARHKKRDSTLSTISVSTAGSESSDEDDDDDDEEGGGGWGGWSFGFGANGAKGMGMPVKSTEWGGPSQGDLMRGFTGFESDEDEDSEMMGEEGGMYEGENEGGECVPGIYRALYAFEPEGPAEMRLVEDQMVKVVGRGGGVGWAVALREESEGGGQALVPEDYLELVTPDPALGWIGTAAGGGELEVGNESIESVEEGEEEDGSPLMVDNVFPTPTSASTKESSKEQELVTPTAPEGHHMTSKEGATNGNPK